MKNLIFKKAKCSLGKLGFERKRIFIGKISAPTLNRALNRATNQQTNQNKNIDIKTEGKFAHILSKLTKDKIEEF
jgi:hypothetical protein